MSSVQPDAPSAEEIAEVVYSLDVADSRPTLTQRMERVEAALGLGTLHEKGTRVWTRDHWLALSISVGTVVLIVIAYLAWLQPQWKERQARRASQHAQPSPVSSKRCRRLAPMAYSAVVAACSSLLRFDDKGRGDAGRTGESTAA